MKHTVRCGGFLYLVLIISLCLAGSPTVVSVMAGGKPSPETCSKKGLLDVSCIVCDTGEYKGKVSVQAEYDPDYDDCMKRYREARNLCINTYNLDSSNAGCKWKYSMGGTDYTGSYPSGCKK